MNSVDRTLQTRERDETRITYTHPVVRAALEISRLRMAQNCSRPVGDHHEMLHGATLVDAYLRSPARG